MEYPLIVIFFKRKVTKKTRKNNPKSIATVFVVMTLKFALKYNNPKIPNTIDKIIWIPLQIKFRKTIFLAFDFSKKSAFPAY